MTHKHPNRIRQLRLASGLSTAKLAEAVGCDRSTIVRAESGRTRLLAETAMNIARVFGVPVEQLYEPELSETGAAA